MPQFRKASLWLKCFWILALSSLGGLAFLSAAIPWWPFAISLAIAVMGITHFNAEVRLWRLDPW